MRLPQVPYRGLEVFGKQLPGIKDVPYSPGLGAATLALQRGQRNF
jgi:hypothetical protein